MNGSNTQPVRALNGEIPEDILTPNSWASAVRAHLASYELESTWVETSTDGWADLIAEKRPDGVAEIRTATRADRPDLKGAGALLDADALTTQQGAFPVREDGVVLLPPIITLGRIHVNYRTYLGFARNDGTRVSAPIRARLFWLPDRLKGIPDGRHCLKLPDPDGREFVIRLFLSRREAIDGVLMAIGRDFSRESVADIFSPARVRELRRLAADPPNFMSRYRGDLENSIQPNSQAAAVMMVSASCVGLPSKGSKKGVFPFAGYYEFDIECGDVREQCDAVVSIRADQEVAVRVGNFEWKGTDYNGPPLIVADSAIRVEGRARVGGIMIDMCDREALMRGLVPEAILVEPGGAKWRWTANPWTLTLIHNGKRRLPPN